MCGGQKIKNIVSACVSAFYSRQYCTFQSFHNGLLFNLYLSFLSFTLGGNDCVYSIVFILSNWRAKYNCLYFSFIIFQFPILKKIINWIFIFINCPLGHMCITHHLAANIQIINVVCMKKSFCIISLFET